ncbi:MAG: hypothetical protein P8Y71_21765 [Pseudolabrys sp.]|jgi:hypothetical protein
MNFLHQNRIECNEASWPAIVDLILGIVSHRERLLLKRKALGRRKRKLARKFKRREYKRKAA